MTSFEGMGASRQKKETYTAMEKQRRKGADSQNSKNLLNFLRNCKKD
jgi:hypothetical protein